jgi:hypothetical protein
VRNLRDLGFKGNCRIVRLGLRERSFARGFRP